MEAHVNKVTAHLGSTVANIFKSLPPVDIDAGYQLVNKDAFISDVNRVKVALQGFLDDPNFDYGNAAIAVDRTGPGVIHVRIESPCELTSNHIAYSITQIALDHFGYRYEAPGEYWGDYQFYFNDESNIPLIIDENVPYAMLDTLVSEDALDGLLKRTNGLIPIYKTDGSMVSVKSLGKRVIAIV